MPRRRLVYDPQLKETPEWQILYGRYNSINPIYREMFETFLEFYHWAMENGFESGLKLVREDPTKPYTPDNCRWTTPGKAAPFLYGEERENAIKKWNEAVNRIRVHYGLAPF